MNFLKKYSKPLRALLLIFVLVLFVIFFAKNIEDFERLRDTSILTIVVIIFGQSLVIFANIMILRSIALIENKKMSVLESTEITSYSSVVNFFGFLQAGVGLRAVFLKKRLGISYKKYLLLTFYQFMVLFGVSFILIIIGFIILGNFLSSLFIILTCLVSLLLAALFIGSLRRTLINVLGLIYSKNTGLLWLVLFVLIQLCGSFIAYAAELDSIGANISLPALLIFTGVSQFSIIFAVTPGALGIREGLLILVSQQMLISTNEIVVAATLDRLVYFVTLAIFTPAAYLAKTRYSSYTKDKNA